MSVPRTKEEARLSTLAEIIEVAASAKDSHALFEFALERIYTLVNADSIAIIVPNSDYNGTIIASSIGMPQNIVEVFSKQELCVGTGEERVASLLSKSQGIQKLEKGNPNDPVVCLGVALGNKEGVAGVIPIILRRTGIIGVLAVFSEAQRDWRPEMVFLSACAASLALVIENLNLVSEIRDTEKRWRQVVAEQQEAGPVSDSMREFASFALDRNLVSVAVFVMGDTGPVPVVHDDLPPQFASAEELLTKVAIFHMSALGQGETYPTGLFELPVPGEIGYRSLTYTFMISDDSVLDERMKGQTFCMLTVFIPEGMRVMLPDFRELESRLLSLVGTVSDVKDLDHAFIARTKSMVLGEEDA